MRTLGQILGQASTDGYINKNPVAGIDLLPNGGRKEIRPASPVTVVALANEIDPRYRAAILLSAFGTGMRAGELWALRTDQVNLLRRSARVVASVGETKGGVLVVKPYPKNGKPRSISLDREMVHIIARHMEEYPPVNGLIFASPTGRQVRHGNFRSRFFLPAVKRVGAQLPGGFRFHDPPHAREPSHRPAMATGTGEGTPRARFHPDHLRHVRAPVRRPRSL